MHPSLHEWASEKNSERAIAIVRGIDLIAVLDPDPASSPIQSYATRMKSRARKRRDPIRQEDVMVAFQYVDLNPPQAGRTNRLQD